MANITEIKIPDIGDVTDVDVIEVLVNIGDEVAKDDPLITLEGDKATMEIPSPYAGKIKTLKTKVGDKVSQGDLIFVMDVLEETVAVPSVKPAPAKTIIAAEKPVATPVPQLVTPTELPSFAGVHAGPAVRRIAREFGIDLTKVKGTSNKGRISKDDVKNFVKRALAGGAAAGGLGLTIVPAPKVDFSEYGEIEVKPLNKIKKLTGQNVYRSWVTVPHVTQFDEADITEMEAFRKSHKHEAEEKGFKLTPLVFIMKAVVDSLQEFPQFNASLDATGENLVFKKYFHIGIAIDTPNGLVVPVIRDVDQKGMLRLAEELSVISKKARKKGLSMAEMSGSCFTISSLGGIGGTAFTPILNTPDVAILGVSRATIKPVYQNNEFTPRLMLPLSLSYDHRVIDGADAARFTTHLGKVLTDMKNLLM